MGVTHLVAAPLWNRFHFLDNVTCEMRYMSGLNWVAYLWFLAVVIDRFQNSFEHIWNS